MSNIWGVTGVTGIKQDVVETHRILDFSPPSAEYRWIKWWGRRHVVERNPSEVPP